MSYQTARLSRQPIATSRLLLRPSQRQDAARAFEIQSDWQVTRMLRMATFPPDRGAIEDWFAGHEAEWRQGTAYRFAVERSGRMIGLVDIDEIAGQEGELGYWFEQVSWGQGFAFEAATALIAFAFNEAGLSRLQTGHATDNIASGKVLARLGFTPLGTVAKASLSRCETVMQQCWQLQAPEQL